MKRRDRWKRINEITDLNTVKIILNIKVLNIPLKGEYA
jgi:hypothetical protein